MKRLLGLLGLTCLVVLTACFYLGTFVASVLAIAAIILFSVSMLIKKIRCRKTIPVMCLTALFAVSLFMGYTQLYVNPIREAYDNKEVSVKAEQISGVYYSYGYYCYPLKCEEIDGTKVGYKLLLRSKDVLYSDVGDMLEFTAELTFNAKNIGPSERIFLHTWIQKDHNVKVIETDTKNLRCYICSIRNNLSNALYLEMDYDTANFSSAVMLGNKHSLSSEIKTLLRITGLSHVSVVSGLHLSVIGTLLTKIFRSVLRKKYASFLFSIAGTTAFAVLSGLGVSVVRSLIMFIICSVGTMIGRKSDSVNSIGAAALVLILPNPYVVGDIGMLLSFSATLGIILWYPNVFGKLMKKVEKVSIFVQYKAVYKFLKGLISAFACTLCATLWILPICIIAFKGFSLVSLIANIFVVPFMSVILFCIALCLLTHYVGFFAVLTDALSWIVSVFYDYLITLCTAFSKLPFAYIHTTRSYFIVWVVLTIGLVLLAYCIKKKFMNVMTVLLSLFLLFSFSAVHRFTHRNSLTLYVPYTGSGVSVILESSDGYAVLGASGTCSKIHKVGSVAESIMSSGNDVFVFLPGYNSEIYAENLVNEFDYSAVLRYDINSNIPLTCDEILFKDKHHLNLWDKADITLIPCKDKVFVYIETGDKTILIAPRYSDCSLLPDNYRSADILISQGEVDGAKLLEFNTLIAPGDGLYDDDSIGYLLSVSNNTIRGDEIVYDMDTR